MYSNAIRWQTESAAQAVPGERAGENVQSQMRRLQRAYTGADSGWQAYLLVLRFALFNLVAFAALGAAYLEGWVETVFAQDQTRLTLIISAAFAVGWAIAARKTWQTSREINQAKAASPHASSRADVYLAEIEGRSVESRALSASSLRLKLFSRIAVIRHVAGALVVLGLIGTVLGFIIALSGVRPEAAADVNSISPMVATLIQGMSIALYTTLVGAVLNVWLMVCYRILATGTVNLFAALIDLGESRGRD